MKVVKCENGHFFDLEKGNICPRCGSDEYTLTGVKEESAPLDKKAIKAQVKLKKAEEKLREKEYKKQMKTIKKGGYYSEPQTFKPIINSMTGEEYRYNMGPTGDFVDYGNVTGRGISVQQDDSKTEKLVSISPDVSAQPIDDKTQMDLSDAKTVYYEDFATSDIEPVVGWLVCVEGNDRGNSYSLKTGVNNLGRAVEMDVSIRNDVSISRDRHAILIYEPKNREFFIEPGIGRGVTYLNGNIVLNSQRIGERDCIQMGKTKLVFVSLCSIEFGWE